VADERHPDCCDRRVVQTLEIQKSALEMCAKRLSLSELDVDALEVQHRLMTCNDLVSEEAVHHRKCNTDFFLISNGLSQLVVPYMKVKKKELRTCANVCRTLTMTC